MEKGFIQVPLDKLIRAKWNYKIDDAALKEKLKENIKRNGQVENIVVRELPKGLLEVINGNHRLDSFSELGFTSVYCFNCGKIPEIQAKRLAIELNESRFESDFIKLSENIGDLLKAFGAEDLDKTLPYSQEEMTDLVKSLEFDWSQISESTESKKERKDSGRFVDLSLSLPKNVWDNWMKWKKRAEKLLGYDSDVKCFEFAVIEALNTPEESLK